jgi:hypothetical protein
MTTAENLPAPAPAAPAGSLAVGNGTGGALAHVLAGLPELAKGLLAAIAQCKPVPKGARNDFHKYAYAEADAIIEEGRAALLAGGCALLPVSASLNGSEREGPDRFELVRVFVLIHSSGQAVPLQVTWPVVPDRGRPLDKATAAADTLSLAYLLRDLLLMNRVDPADDVSARQDQPTAAVGAAADRPASGDRHRILLRRCHLTLARRGRTWAKALGFVGLTPPDSWEEPPAGPDGVAAALAMESWVNADACAAILQALTPKPKPAAAAAPFN